MEVDLITASGDGVGPAVLLSLGTRLKSQYIFNVPEGFSRFVLEHKLRPGLGLRAVFCPDLLASMGLPGLLMRLRGEGHGQVEILGPSGALPFVSSLRHFVRWKHPAVLVSEEQDRDSRQQSQGAPRGAPPLKKVKEEEEANEDEYSDENIAAKFIWVGATPTTDWKSPDWLLERSTATATNTDLDLDHIMNENNDDSSDTDTSSSSNDSSTSEDSQSATSSSSSSSDDDDGEAEEKINSHADAMFASLDAAFLKSSGSGGSSRLRAQALGLLKSSKTKEKGSERGEAKGSSLSHSDKKTTTTTASSGGERLLSMLAAMEKSAVPSDPTRRQVENRVYTRCEAEGISLFARERNNSPLPPPPPLSAALVAFLCLLKASNQVLLVINCTNEEQLRQLHAHPAVHAMSHLPKERCAGCIFMLGPGLSHLKCAQDLFSTLQQPQPQPTMLAASPPSMSLFILEQPGIGSFSTELGYISSARMASRLNMVSQRMFPLPMALKSHLPQPPPRPSSASQQQQENETETSRFYVHKLTKIVWLNGQPVITVPKVDAETAGKEFGKVATTTEKTSSSDDDDDDQLDVDKLQAAVLEADPELKTKLHQLSESLPPAYRNNLVNFKPPPPPPPPPPEAAAAGGVGVKKRQQEEMAMQEIDGTVIPKNKRAAAVLQAQLKQSNGTSTNASRFDTESQFKPPPPPNPPPPPPPVPLSQEPEVIFLGTGSAEPSQHRGASAIYLNPGHGHAGFLLDCGEGCYGQLVRFYGPRGAGAFLSKLAGIWISHRHADHMSGILQILSHYPSTAPPMLLIGPRSLQAWLAEAAAAVGLSHLYIYAHCSEVQQPHHWAFHRICSSLGLLGVATVPVRHCSDAFGIVLRHGTGWTLVYSGDTEPSEALVRAGSGATLLIHEATFEPALASEARKKRHSTSVEAMDVARRMGAYNTVLTHFSQRYPKFPEGVAEAVAAEIERGEGSSVGVAFDGMCLPLGLLGHLPAVTVAVEAVLAAATLASEKQKEEAGF